MPNLEKAAEEFDSWMKEFEDSHRKYGHLADNNKALVSFLDDDKGFQYVKTYEELCQLAEILNQRFGYKTTNPPCSEAHFVKAMEMADPRSFGDDAYESPRMK